MVDGLQSTDLIDPFLGYSTFSLFPRTFGGLTKAAESEQHDMESIHSYLNSMTLRSPNKLLEQAKTILSSSSELLNSEFQCHVASEDKDGAVAARVKDRLQKRRPSLGRKRARFSLKPITSQPSLDVDSSLNIDHLEDPEEFFLAYEKLQNAKKELQKQRGDILMGSNQYDLSTTVRHRRPGLLGKTASYKHHYSSVHANNDETFVSSQETLEVDISGPPNNSSNRGKTNQHGIPEEWEISDDELIDIIQEIGSVAEKEKRVYNLFDELLSANCTNLEGEGAVTYLCDRSQIKPITFDKLCLPGLDNIIRNDLEVPAVQLPRPRKALSDINNTIERANSKTPEEHRQVLGGLICPQASPPQLKSPFAKMSFLNRRSLLMNPSSDPFSFLAVDVSPYRHSSPIEGIDKQALSPYVGTSHRDVSNPTPAEVDRKGLDFSGELQSQLIEEDNTADKNMDSRMLVTEDLASLFKRPADDNSSRINTDNDIGLNGSEGVLEDKMQVEDVLQQVDDNSSRINTNNDVKSNGSEGVVEDKMQIEDVLQQAVASELPELGIEDQSESGLTIVEYCPVRGHTKTTNIPLERDNETNHDPSRIPFNVPRKPKAPPRKRGKRKELSHRQSLAGAGSLWESGVRRSNRIKMRPLEYWNGERFLYGRIHNSLATVIGLKYVSPAKGKGNPTVKVKSYVSDKYKNLVEQAALH